MDGKQEAHHLEGSLRMDPQSETSSDIKNNASQGQLKTKNGVVLMPQPSDDPNDPLNWSSLRKHLALVTLSYLAFVSYVAVTSPIPGTLELAKQFGVTKDVAVYLGNTPVALYAVGPLLWNPISHFTGRRPVLILANLIAIAGNIVAASAQSYAACMVGRVILGFGGSAFWLLGPPSISDMFFRHERGKKIGLSTLAIVVSPFAGGIIGGAIIDNESLGWRWSQWIPLILVGVGLLAQIVFVPETMYIRKTNDSGEPSLERAPTQATLWSRYGIHAPKRDADKNYSFYFVFLQPFLMFKYPVIVLSSFWFGVAYMLHVGITAEIPLIFEAAPYNFTVLDVGLSAFSGMIGALLGEAYAGPAIDFIAKKCLKQEREWRPEMRLNAIWPALIAAPGGLIMFGVSIQFGHNWVTPLVGQGLYIFGIEIATTVIQTYLLESYPRHGVEASLVFNLSRNLLSYTAPFFVPIMLRKIGGGATFGIIAALIVFFFPVTVGILMWRGKELRERMGMPRWSRD